MELIEILILVGLAGGLIVGRAWLSFRKNKWMFLLTLILSLPVLNIAAFILLATILGGDAINGHAEAGHYFLRAHGKETEVSRAVFNYSRIHAYTTIAPFALLLLAGLAVFLLNVLGFFLKRRNRYRLR